MPCLGSLKHLVFLGVGFVYTCLIGVQALSAVLLQGEVTWIRSGIKSNWEQKGNIKTCNRGVGISLFDFRDTVCAI